MIVLVRRSLAATLLVAAATITPTSCARDDSSLFIRGNMVITRTDCSVTVSTTPNLVFSGSIDAAYAGEYVGTLLVENQIVARGNANTLKTETSGVQLYEAEVQVLDPAQGGNAISQFSVPVAGFIDPGQSNQPGAGATDVVMIDAATLQKLAGQVGSTGKQQQVVSSVVIRGRTLGGLEEHTQEFLYPILVSFGSSCTSTPGMPCVGGMATASMVDCRPAIDEVVSCQQIAASFGACKTLHCPTLPSGKSDLANAVCPGGPPDNSCCNP